jgi:hypothetical protein
MTEQRTPAEFERRLGELVMAYTEAATERSSDLAQLARTAWAAGARRRAWPGWPVAEVLGGWFGGPRAAVGLVAIVLVGVALIAIQGRRPEPVVTQPSASRAPASPGDSPSSDASILEILGRGWQRPSPVAPGPDLWGSGSLTLTDGRLAFGREPGAGQSTIAVDGPSTFTVTATDATPGCRAGDVGRYGWVLEGQETVLTLTPQSPDGCTARESLLAGPWVRAGLVGAGLVPGTHHSAGFDPFGDPRRPAELVYTVPAGWDVVQDDVDTFVLHQPADASAGRFTTDLMIAIWPDPALIAEVPDGAPCDVDGAPVGDAPGVGRTRDELVAGIRARAGVVSSQARPVTFGDVVGQELDLQLATTWTGGCTTPEGRVATLPFLHMSGSAGPVVALSANAPVRLILVDVASDRTLAIVLFRLGPSGPATFGELFGAAMPVVGSFAFEPRVP